MIKAVRGGDLTDQKNARDEGRKWVLAGGEGAEDLQCPKWASSCGEDAQGGVFGGAKPCFGDFVCVVNDMLLCLEGGRSFDFERLVASCDGYCLTKFKTAAHSLNAACLSLQTTYSRLSFKLRGVGDGGLTPATPGTEETPSKGSMERGRKPFITFQAFGDSDLHKASDSADRDVSSPEKGVKYCSISPFPQQNFANRDQYDMIRQAVEEGMSAFMGKLPVQNALRNRYQNDGSAHASFPEKDTRGEEDSNAPSPLIGSQPCDHRPGEGKAADGKLQSLIPRLSSLCTNLETLLLSSVFKTQQPASDGSRHHRVVSLCGVNYSSHTAKAATVDRERPELRPASTSTLRLKETNEDSMEILRKNSESKFDTQPSKAHEVHQHSQSATVHHTPGLEALITSVADASLHLDEDSHQVAKASSPKSHKRRFEEEEREVKARPTRAPGTNDAQGCANDASRLQEHDLRCSEEEFCSESSSSNISDISANISHTESSSSLPTKSQLTKAKPPKHSAPPEVDRPLAKATADELNRLYLAIFAFVLKSYAPLLKQANTECYHQLKRAITTHYKEIILKSRFTTPPDPNAAPDPLPIGEFITALASDLAKWKTFFRALSALRQ